MRIKPVWWVGVIVYIIYNTIIFATWAVNGADYTKMVGPDVVFKSIVAPLALGAIFMVIALTWLGWWRPVMKEDRPGRPRWTLWIILLIMLGMILVNSGATNWSAIGTGHLALLITAGVLVGFNEEALTRGVLVVGWRGSTPNEAWVWLWATFLFGLMHLPNGFFGLGLGPAAMQVGFAFLAGCGFYVLRRVSGGLVLPMILHGAWDFANFSRQASGAEAPELVPVFQFGTYLVSIALVILVLRAGKRNADPVG